MKVKRQNLFSTLLKWAHRQDENFVTDSFVYLLDHLLVADREVAAQLVHWLAFGSQAADGGALGSSRVRTQVTTDEGRPDVVIESDSLFCIVEVKKESGPGETQVRRYLRLVEKRRGGRTGRFVFLSVYRVDFAPDEPRPHRCVLWHEIAGWLRANVVTDQVSRFLVSEFVAFLQEEVMAVERVEWDYVRGMTNFRRMTGMLAKAIEAAGVPQGVRSAGQDFNGWYLEGKSYWIGVMYDVPGRVRLSFQNAKFDEQKLKEIGTAEWVDGAPKFILDLESEAVHFFARETDSQLAVLTDFVRRSYRDAKACTVGGSPVVAES